MQVTTPITEMMREIHQLAREKGWYGPDLRPVPELLCLIHSEVTEALQAWRKHEGAEALAHEMADIVIRVFDACEYLEIDLPGAIVAKHNYNGTRPARHGGRKC